MAKLRNEVLSCIITPELQRIPSTKLLSRFQTRGCVAQSRGFELSNLRFGTLKSSFCGALLRFLEVFEIHKLTPNFSANLLQT